jgi:hypothetical protein
MSTLHIVSSSPFETNALQSALKFVSPSDAILLIENGVYAAVDSGVDFTGGVFPREALALDWRRAIRVEAERDASRRGTELNMSGVYAHGVWRATLGVQMLFDATAPSA